MKWSTEISSLVLDLDNLSLYAGFSEMAMTSVNYLSYGKWKVVGTEAEFQGH